MSNVLIYSQRQLDGSYEQGLEFVNGEFSLAGVRVVGVGRC